MLLAAEALLNEYEVYVIGGMGAAQYIPKQGPWATSFGMHLRRAWHAWIVPDGVVRELLTGTWSTRTGSRWTARPRLP